VPTPLNLADHRAAAVSPIQRKDRLLEAILQAASIERRSKVRFPLELRVHFRTLGRRHPVSGAGSVVNMSSGGVLVASQHDIKTVNPNGNEHRMAMPVRWTDSTSTRRGWKNSA